MGLFPKQIADMLFQTGRMPEWWYRQNYKTFQENWIDSFHRDKEKYKECLEVDKQAQQQKELEKQIDSAVKKALDKTLSNLFSK